MMQRAVELKEYKNMCKGAKPYLLIASKSNESFIAKSRCVDISLGCNDAMVDSNVEYIKSKDLDGRIFG
jgi:hypothetical protein